jgi:hypothetical protein
LGKTSEVVEGFSVVVGDSQYSSGNVRECVREYKARPVIPYMSNQAVGEPVLRVDRYFRTSGPEDERLLYGVGRACVERVNSRLEAVGLVCLKFRGLRRVRVHVLLCVVVVLLVAVAAYRRRQSVEVYIRDMKQNLRLGEYQARRGRGAILYRHLVYTAYTLLVLLRRSLVSASGRLGGVLRSIGDGCRWVKRQCLRCLVGLVMVMARRYAKPETVYRMIGVKSAKLQ